MYLKCNDMKNYLSYHCAHTHTAHKFMETSVRIPHYFKSVIIYTPEKVQGVTEVDFDHTSEDIFKNYTYKFHRANK